MSENRFKMASEGKKLITELAERVKKIEASGEELKEAARLKAECRSAAVRYQSYRVRPSGKLKEHLRAQGFQEDLLDEITDELKEDGYIKDGAIMEAQWNKRKGRRSESLSFFCRRMKEFGISENEISKFRKSFSEKSPDAENAYEFLSKKFSAQIAELSEIKEPYEKMKLKAKIFRAGMRKGFSESVLRKALEAVLKEENK